jgi:hypothetical protein
MTLIRINCPENAYRRTEGEARRATHRCPDAPGGRSPAAIAGTGKHAGRFKELQENTAKTEVGASRVTPAALLGRNSSGFGLSV